MSTGDLFQDNSHSLLCFGRVQIHISVSSTWALFLLEARAPFTLFSFKVQWSNKSIWDVLLLPQQPEFWMFLQKSLCFQSPEAQGWQGHQLGSNKTTNSMVHIVWTFIAIQCQKCFTKIHYCLHRTAVKIRVEHAREEEKSVQIYNRRILTTQY